MSNLDITLKNRFESLEKFASDKLNQFGLAQTGWSFSWNRAKKFLGFCIYDKKLITLSGFYTANLNNKIEVLQNTVLHEVAHALAGHEAGHGANWKHYCLITGADPSRLCTDPSVVSTAKPRYIATCPSCLKVYKMFRRPKYGLNAGHYCTKCGSFKGKLSWSCTNA